MQRGLKETARERITALAVDRHRSMCTMVAKTVRGSTSLR
jgi:hypothetical protein